MQLYTILLTLHPLIPDANKKVTRLRLLIVYLVYLAFLLPPDKGLKNFFPIFKM